MEYDEYIDKFNQIDIMLEDYPVVIKNVKSTSIRVIFPKSADKDDIDFSVVDGKFIIKHRIRRWLGIYLNFFHSREQVIIEISEQYKGVINIKTCNGSIKTEDVIEPSMVKLSTSNGSIHVEGIKSNNISLNSKNGSIQLEQIVADHIIIETKNGSIKGMIMGNLCDYNINSYTVNGSNNLPQHMDSPNDKDLSVRTCNGKISIQFMSMSNF